MSTGLHKDLAIAEGHKAHSFEYANASARTGASGFVAGDVGKLARQLDDNSFWVLTATTPTWVAVGSGGTPAAHKTSHQDGGSDEISVAGLSGVLADAQTPTSHATSHQSGGGDAIKLDDLSTPDDNTDLNATTSAHGLLPKLGSGTSNFLRADGTWNVPAGSLDQKVAVDVAATPGFLGAASNDGVLRTGSQLSFADGGDFVTLDVDEANIKLDDLGTPDDNTDLNATTAGHGLLQKLGGGTTNFLRADGTWNAPSKILLQRKGAEITADTTTTSTSWVDLLTVSITTGANVLEVLFTTGITIDGKGADQIDFRITVDGSAKRGVGSTASDEPESAALLWRGAVTAAAHTVKIQWKVNDGTGQIRPVSAPDNEHASVVVAEYTE